MKNMRIIKFLMLISFFYIFVCSNASGAIKQQDQPIELIGLEDGIMELQMDSPKKKNFQLLLKNPKNNSKREVEIEDLKLSDNDRTIIGNIPQDNRHLILEPNMQRHLTIAFDDIPKGNYEGILIIKDFKNKEVIQKFNVKLKSTFLTLNNFADMKEIFLLVFLGAIVSLILTKALPISARKKDNDARIAELNRDIKYFTAFELSLNIKFSVELHKAKNLNDNTKIYTPSAQSRLDSINAILKKLENQLNTRKDISRVYIDIDSTDFLPFSLEEKIRSKLQEADLNLYMDKTDIALKIKDEAIKMFQINAAEYSETLGKKIHEFIEKDIKKEGAIVEFKNFKIEDKNMVHLIDELSDFAEKRRKKDNIEEIKRCDIIWQKVDIYFNRFLAQLLRDSFPEEENEILRLLKSDRYEDIKMAAAICDSLRQFGVSEKMIEGAINENKINIKCFPSDPDINGWVNFKLQFEDEYINKSPLRNNFRYIWDFGDKTKRAEGIEVIHYFKRRGAFILLRKWLRRNLSIVFKDLREWKKFDVSVNISNFRSNEDYSEIGPITIPINESRGKSYSSGITFFGVFGFLLIFFLSCFIAVASAYDETYSFKSFKDILTPFLIGFSLDISREKFLKTIK